MEVVRFRSYESVRKQFCPAAVPDGDFEFLYGNIANGAFSQRTYSGFSNGDDQNINIWPNWDFDNLANQSFRYHQKTLPPGTSVSPSGLLTISGADSSVTYNLPVKVTDSRKIFDIRSFSYSQELVIDEEIESENNALEYGKPAWFNVKITNNGQTALNNIRVILRTPEDAITIGDSTEEVSVINAGETATVDHAFAFILDSILNNQYVVPFRIICSSEGREWLEDVSLLVSAPAFTVASPEIDDGSNGMLEPGEVADIVFRVRNAIGAANAKDVAITFVSPDTLIHIVSPPVQTADQINAGTTSEFRYQLRAGKTAVAGHSAAIRLIIGNAQTGDVEFPFSLHLGKIPAALIKLTGNTNSADSMASALDALGLNYSLLFTMPEDLDRYSTVFVLPGTASSGTHHLLQSENLLLSGYLNNGGNLYMEEWSGNWNMGTALQIHSYFKYSQVISRFSLSMNSRG